MVKSSTKARVEASVAELRADEVAANNEHPLLAPLVKRKARLMTLIERMNGGKDVATRDLKLALTKAEFQAFESAWHDQQSLRASAKQKPTAIVAYEKRLKQARFEYSKAEGYSGSTRRKPTKGSDGRMTNERGYARSEAICEKIIEYLQEQLSANPALCGWFDRDIAFGPAGDLGTTPDQLPQVVTSRSLEGHGSGFLVGKRSKREVKLTALRDAVAAIEDEEKTFTHVAARIKEEDELAAAEARRRSIELRRLSRR